MQSSKLTLPKYSVELRSAPLSASAEWCFPGAIKGAFVKGLSIEFILENHEAWFGSFEAGSISPNAANGFFRHPDPWKACVVSSGQGYVLDVRNPSDWSEIDLRPIMGVVEHAEAGVLILWDFTRFAAMGADGLRWKTPSISWDGIKDVRVSGDLIVSSVWDAATSKFCQVEVNANTGEFVGGASPQINHQ